MVDWFKRRPRPPVARRQRAVDFLGEQDGVPARELKAELRTVLEAESQVQTAYLARVTYENSAAPEVALCLRAELKEHGQMVLVTEVGRVFAARFGRKEHLDILFLTPEDEVLLRAVCSAFFRRAA
jgi:hypothetical protein